MGRRGDEWHHVIPLDPPDSAPKNSTRRNRCLYCNKEFVGGATRIRAHLTGEMISTNLDGFSLLAVGEEGL